MLGDDVWMVAGMVSKLVMCLVRACFVFRFPSLRARIVVGRVFVSLFVCLFACLLVCSFVRSLVRLSEQNTACEEVKSVSQCFP